MFCVFVCVSVGGWVSEWVGVGVQMPVCDVVVHLLPSDSHSLSSAGNQWILA